MGRHLDGDGHAVCDHVVDGGAPLGSLHDLAELFLWGVARHVKRHADPFEPVARFIVHAQRAAYVHVASERRLDGREFDLARRGHVDDRCRQASGERVQQVLGRVGARVAAEQDRRLPRVDHKLFAASGVLPAGGVKALDRRTVMRPVDPAVGGAELEPRQLRLRLDQIQRREQFLGVHAVADRFGDCTHL